MKHNIVFKFVAFLLCAVTLLGAVGSAAGIFVMTEMDLFDKTVEQLRQEQLHRNGEAFAREAALRYASQTLGSCPEEMVNNHYGLWMDSYYQSGQYGYTILDAEGNAVYTAGTAGEDASVFRFPVSGQYLHMVSQETQTEKENRQQAQTASYSANFTVGENTHIMDALTPEGQHVAYASLCDGVGNVVYEAYDADGVGFLYYNREGLVTFVSSRFVEDPALAGMSVAGVFFQSLDGTVVYEATSGDGVGVLTLNDGGQLRFTAGLRAEDIVVEAPAETEPEPVEETLPQETAPAAMLPVYYAAFYDDTDEKIYRVRGGSDSVGFLSLDGEGRLVYRGFQKEENRLSEELVLTGAYFCDIEDNRVYEIYSNESIGTIAYTDNGQMIFTSAEPVSGFDPAEDMYPVEEAEETVPEETWVEEETWEEEEEPQEQSSASEIPEDVTTLETTVEETAAATEATLAPTEPATEPVVTEETVAETVVPRILPAQEETRYINGKPLEEYHVETEGYYDADLEESVYVSYVRVPMPEYTVELYLAPGAMGMTGEYQLLAILKTYSGYLFPALGICLLVFAICAVYLCCAAGRKPGSDEVHAGGLNCLPLDLYTVLAVLGLALAANIGVETVMYRLDENFLFSCTLAVAMAGAASLLLVAYCFAIVAQAKTPRGYWWRNTLCIRFVMLFMHFGVWLEKFLARKLLPFLGRTLKWLWNLLWNVLVMGFFRLWQRFADWFLRTARRFFWRVYRWLHRFLSLLPVTWQWLAAGFVMFLLMLVPFATNGEELLSVLCLGACAGILVYGAHCFGILSESTKRMSRGDLDTKVDDKLLIGCFKDFAGELNDLADVAVVAAQKQLKSERMKTELITNVSHDIKTPLTSIINYVDLLQKPHEEAQTEQYLEVLSRQSQRLKKLIDDLMDMSKASTGNMTVEITTVDGVESVNQALGEFADKLAAARLMPVFRHTEERAAMMADGKLVWRVLSNVLSNAVKYAMPGTRLYIDLMELEGKVVISLKNISREELNMDAEELMERFVRGDDSRNTEGSGLGLNIAKSLMELQKGQLQLLVDGDLFKVTLIFPGA